MSQQDTGPWEPNTKNLPKRMQKIYKQREEWRKLAQDKTKKKAEKEGKTTAEAEEACKAKVPVSFFQLH